jgi:hypothetical protein
MIYWNYCRNNKNIKGTWQWDRVFDFCVKACTILASDARWYSSSNIDSTISLRIRLQNGKCFKSCVRCICRTENQSHCHVSLITILGDRVFENPKTDFGRTQFFITASGRVSKCQLLFVFPNQYLTFTYSPGPKLAFYSILLPLKTQLRR